jgi:acylpyruvate hydrolase
MKLMRYNTSSQPETLARLGVLVNGDLVGDLRAAYARYLVEEKGDSQGREIAALRLPGDLRSFISIGAAASNAAKSAYEYLSGLAKGKGNSKGLEGEPLLVPLAECFLHPILQPSKLIAVGRNYAEHLSEMTTSIPMKVPSAWIKANNTIVGPTADVVKPDCVKELDYETELVVVIGKRCKDVPESRAYEVIAGYSVLNDVSARDVVRIERKEGNQLLGKMFDGFAPLGPWLVTADEIADPMNLRVMSRVNGEIRQNGNTKQMIWSIPKLIAYLSQMTLEPGDVISTGTPEGVASGRKPGLPSWFLKAGDVLESEVEKVGLLRNKITAQTMKTTSWKW